MKSLKVHQDPSQRIELCGNRGLETCCFYTVKADSLPPKKDGLIFVLLVRRISLDQNVSTSSAKMDGFEKEHKAMVTSGVKG